MTQVRWDVIAFVHWRVQRTLAKDAAVRPH